MLNRKELSIYFESITKVRLLPLHTLHIPTDVSQELDYCLSTHTHTNLIPTSLCNRMRWIGSRRCYIEKDKTESCHIPTEWTIRSWLCNRKHLLVFFFEMRNWKELSIYFESITKVKLLPFHTDIDTHTHTHYELARDCYMEKNKTELFHIAAVWTVSHLNRESHEVRMMKDASRMINDRNAQLKRAMNFFPKYHKS